MHTGVTAKNVWDPFYGTGCNDENTQLYTRPIKGDGTQVWTN